VIGFRHANSLAQLGNFGMQENALSTLDALNQLFAQMPPVQAMQIRALYFDGKTLQVVAPLSANLNDKACAFGGSLVSIMTMAAWGLLNVKLWQQGLKADVYIADSQVKFLKPVFTDLQARASLSADSDWQTVQHVLQEKQRARAFVNAVVQGPSGEIVADMRAKFALIQTK
jgi:thioesterase domain-containing protein